MVADPWYLVFSTWCLVSLPSRAPTTLPPASLSSSLSSIKNLTKSGIGNRFTSLKKSYLSPGPAT